MEQDLLGAALALVVTLGSLLLGALVVVGPILVIAGVLGVAAWAVYRANNPDAGQQLPQPIQDFVESAPRVGRGQDPRHDAWAAAAEALGLSVEVRPETWTTYGSSALSGRVEGRAVAVSVREHGTLRYTVTRVQADPGASVPAEPPDALTRPTKQGMALVAHAPTLRLDDGALVHEAIGIRDDPGEIAAVVRAMVAIAAHPPG